MQVCGNQGWWEGLVELRRVQREERVVLFPIQQGIAFTALTHCLKEGHKHTVVRERVPIALEMARAHWREVEAAKDYLGFNCSLSSALKLATSLECEAAYTWGREIWTKSGQIAFAKHHITLSSYICFLEQYRCFDEVDALLESQDEVASEAVNVVLLSSLLNCVALRRDWQRAEALWETFMKRQVRPNIICQAALAKVYLLTGRPSKVVEVCDTIGDFVRAMREDYKVGSIVFSGLSSSVSFLPGLYSDRSLAGIHSSGT